MLPDKNHAEVILYFIYPLIRREISQILLLKGYTQKETANLLGVTPSAISQYVNKKRSNFSIKPRYEKQLRGAILNELKKISESEYSKKSFFKLFEKIVQNINDSGLLCKIHLDLEDKKHFDCMDD